MRLAGFALERSAISYRVDDDDLAALFDLNAGVAQRGDGESAARRLHDGRRDSWA